MMFPKLLLDALLNLVSQISGGRNAGSGARRGTEDWRNCWTLAKRAHRQRERKCTGNKRCFHNHNNPLEVRCGEGPIWIQESWSVRYVRALGMRRRVTALQICHAHRSYCARSEGLGAGDET